SRAGADGSSGRSSTGTSRRSVSTRASARVRWTTGRSSESAALRSPSSPRPKRETRTRRGTCAADARARNPLQGQPHEGPDEQRRVEPEAGEHDRHIPEEQETRLRRPASHHEGKAGKETE